VASPAFVWAFGHLASRKSIAGAFLVAGCVVEHEQACCEAVRFPFENVDRPINLFEQIVSCEPAVSILTSFEDNTSLPVVV
jgi:hypothetical protein